MHRRHGIGLVVVLGAALAGCNSGVGKFIPPKETARKALETTLGAWKAGRAKSDALKTGQVTVQVVEDAWESGQSLKEYAITSEEPGDGPRWFTVRLTLAGGEQTVKFAVLGNDPIWVCDEAGYKKLCGGL